jgi:hypothetical protein
MQMTALNVKNPTSYYHALHRHQLEEQHSSACLNLGEQRAITGSVQPIGSTAIIPCNIANSYAYYNYLDMAHTNGTLSYQQLPALPNPIILGKIVPAVRSGSSNTGYSAGHSNGTNSALDLSSHRQSPVALPSQSSPLPSGSGLSALPEQQGFQVDPSRVSNSPVRLSSTSC